MFACLGGYVLLVLLSQHTLSSLTLVSVVTLTGTRQVKSPQLAYPKQRSVYNSPNILANLDAFYCKGISLTRTVFC